MNEQERQPADESQIDAPQALREDLAALFARGPEVPAEIDEAIRAMAGRRLDGKSRRRVLRWLWPAAAAAAVLLVLLWPRPMALHEAPAPEPLQSVALPAPGDVNGSGRVDILDAFALARRIEEHESLKPEWDVNRDGRVDEDDVDTIAKDAVSLSRGLVPNAYEGDTR